MTNTEKLRAIETTENQIRTFLRDLEEEIGEDIASVEVDADDNLTVSIQLR